MIAYERAANIGFEDYAERIEVEKYARRLKNLFCHGG